jgi:hypothetical protein
MEGFFFGEPFHAAREDQSPLVESGLEAIDELAAKDTAENLYRQEKRIARADPVLVVQR